MSKISISIYRDDVWAGDGRIDDDGQIVNCPAILGRSQDESDATYEAIEDVLTAESQDDRYTGSVERPDGMYTWRVTAATD